MIFKNIHNSLKNFNIVRIQTREQFDLILKLTTQN